MPPSPRVHATRKPLEDPFCPRPASAAAAHLRSIPPYFASHGVLLLGSMARDTNRRPSARLLWSSTDLLVAELAPFHGSCSERRAAPYCAAIRQIRVRSSAPSD